MDIVQEYLQLRSYLWTIAYNMTGQVEEAEDIVQDCFEDVLKSKEKNIARPKSYLTRIVIHKSIDRSEALKKHRVSYPGTWLPEPYVTQSDEPLSEEVLPYALLYLMEQLNPLERAIFILRQAFDYSYSDIASFCNKTEANCRQILHRAKGKLGKDDLPTGDGKEMVRPLVEAFLKASLEEKPDGLYALLAQDIRVFSDGGGKAAAARKILEGIQRAVKFLFGITRKSKALWQDVRLVIINMNPGLVVIKNNQTDMVVAFDTAKGKIRNLYIIRNPEKFSSVRMSQNTAGADL